MIPYWLTSPEWTHVVAALLHTLWQGTLIAVLLGLVLRRLTNPVVRYRYALGALAGVIAAGLVTWGILCRPLPAPSSQAPPNLYVAAVPAAVTPSDTAPLIVQVRPLAPKAPDMRWTAWLALLWVVGTMLMLGRAAFQVAGAERLRRSSRPLEDARIMALLAEAREAIGLVRRVRLAVTDQLTSPVVAGVLMPTLILPLSLISSLAPEQIRFILLHELAHIRRGDYFANLFQLFAEALLFFNPAVWWISRQMRLEREACCDALAVELSGAPGDYARTLVRVVENALSPAPAAAPALGDRREPSSLADRLQRMLVPGYRPELRLTWRAMFAALLTGGVLLILSAIGTRVTIAAIPGSVRAGEEQKINTPQVLITGECYWIPPNSTNHMNMIETRTFRNPEELVSYQTMAEKRGGRLLSRPRIQTLSGTSGDLYIGDGTNGIQLNCLPVVTSGKVTLTCVGQLVSAGPGGSELIPITTKDTLENGSGVMIITRGMGQSDTGNALLLLSVEILTNASSASTPATEVQPSRLAQFLIQAEIYLVSPEKLQTLVPGLEFHSGRTDADGWWSASPEQFSRLQTGVKKTRLKATCRPRIQTSNGMQAQFFVGDDDGGTELDCRPTVVDGQVQLDIGAKITGQQPSGRGTNSFAAEALLENHGGMVFSIPAVDGTGASNFMVMVRVEILTNTPPAPSSGQNGILSDTNFRVAMEAMSQRTGVEKLSEPEITTVAGRGENRISMRIESTNGTWSGSAGQSSRPVAVTFRLNEPKPEAEVKKLLADAGVQMPLTTFVYTDSGLLIMHGTPDQLALVYGLVLKLNGNSAQDIAASKDSFVRSLPARTMDDSTNLVMQTFRVDIKQFQMFLKQYSGSETNLVIPLENLLNQLGLDFSPNNGKAVFYNNRSGFLFVKATGSDLATVAQVLAAIPTATPQVHIKARFIEVPVGTIHDFASLTGGQLTGILTDTNARTMLKTLASRSNVEILGEPEVTMLSGRQAQMRVTKVIDVITNFVVDKNGVVMPHIEPVEVGPVLDVAANVLADGYTLNLQVAPSVTEFEGYPAMETNGPSKNQPPVALPVFQTQKLNTQVNLWDNQTVVLGGLVDYGTNNVIHLSSNGQVDPARISSSKELLVLITATIVDSAGSRLHTDADMPFAQGGIPIQPPGYLAWNIGVGNSYTQPAPTSIKTNTTPAHSNNQNGREGDTIFGDQASNALQAVDRAASGVPNKTEDDATLTEPLGQETMTFRLNNPKPEAEIKKLMLDAGVEMPRTAFLFINNGLVIVRGTPDQVELVQRLVLKLNGVSVPENSPDDNSSVQHVSAKAGDESTNLFERTFKMDAHLFPAYLEKLGGSETNPIITLTSLFGQLGVNLNAKAGKTLFYSVGKGWLFVKASASDLDVIERVLEAINLPPPQVHIKARFIEVPKGTTFQGFASLTNDNLEGILTSTNMGVVLHALQSRGGTEILAEPEVTMLSGRQAQMRVTEVITVVTNIAPDATGKLVPQTGTFETGPILDVVPHVLADGYTINLEVTPSLTEFEGYADPGQIETNGASSSQIPKVFPTFQTQMLTATVNLWDNQTVVLGGMKNSSTVVDTPAAANIPLLGKLFTPKTTTSEDEVLIFITATIVDPAGSRVHTEADMPFAQNGVPTQPPSTNKGVFTSHAQPQPISEFPAEEKTALVRTLVMNGTVFYENGKLDEAERPFKSALKLDTNNATAKYYLNLINAARINSDAKPANPSGVFPGQQPIESDSTNSTSDPTPTDLPGQQTMTFRLNDPKPEATVRQLLFDAGVEMPPTTFLCVDNGLLVVHGTPEQLALVNGVVLKLNGHSARDIAADRDRFVQQWGVKADESTNLFMRTFKVDTNRFQVFLKKNGGSETNIVKTFRNLLNQLGLNFDPNTGKALFYGDRLGYLFVKATTSDLDTVERVVQAIHQTTPEIHIKARFIEVPAGTGLPSFTGGQLTGILTDTNTKTILQALTSRTDTESLGEPEVTMLSGQRVQMRATELINVVTNIQPANGVPPKDGDPLISQTGTFEVGSVLDAVAHVLEDGYTISLDVTPSLTEFEGYAQSTNSLLTNGVPIPVPIFKTQKLKSQVNLWDGQTVVLRGMAGGSFKNTEVPNSDNGGTIGGLFQAKRETDKREVLVLITASIVDSTGARVHTDAEMPFAQSGVPTQPLTINSGVVTSFAQPAPTFIKANVSREAEASTLVQDGKLLYEMGKLDEAKAKFNAALSLNPDNMRAPYYLNLIDAARAQSETSQDNTNQTSQPIPKAVPGNDIIYTGPGRQKIVAKMNDIRLDSVSWNGLPLSEVLRQLSVQCKALDPEHKGVNFLINNNPDLSSPPAAASASAGNPGVAPGQAIDPATAQPVAVSPAESGQPDVGSYIIKIPSLSDVRLADALDAIVMVSDHPLKYSILDFAIVFSPRAAASPQLFTRTFLVDPNTFNSGLEGVGSRSFGVNQNNNGGVTPVVGVVNTFSGEGAVRSSGSGGGSGGSGDATLQSLGSQGGGATHNSPAEMAKLDLFMTQHNQADAPTNSSAVNVSHRAAAYFTTLGVNFQSPPGKAIFYNDRTDILAVKATKEDLEIIERALKRTNAAHADFQTY